MDKLNFYIINGLSMINDCQIQPYLWMKIEKMPSNIFSVPGRHKKSTKNKIVPQSINYKSNKRQLLVTF
jgi:hypothetical protein